MIVIFEGPDGAGKDFVRKAFEEATNFEHVVVTRLFVSQAVYARFYNRMLHTNPGRWKGFKAMVLKFFLQFDVLMVYVYADATKLNERVAARGELIGSQPTPRVIMDSFDLLIRELGLEKKTIKLDTTFDPDMEELVSRIKGKIKSMDKRG